MRSVLLLKKLLSLVVPGRRRRKRARRLRFPRSWGHMIRRSAGGSWLVVNWLFAEQWRWIYGAGRWRRRWKCGTQCWGRTRVWMNWWSHIRCMFWCFIKSRLVGITAQIIDQAGICGYWPFRWWWRRNKWTRPHRFSLWVGWFMSMSVQVISWWPEIVQSQTLNSRRNCAKNEWTESRI